MVWAVSTRIRGKLNADGKRVVAAPELCYDAKKGLTMIELTAEQHRVLASNGKDCARVIDPATQVEYVLVPAESYDRIKSLLLEDSDWQQGTHAAAMEIFARDGWNDPRMDLYDALDPRKDP